MSENKSSTAGGIGFFGTLTIVFIVLKLTHLIDWAWVWVLAPAWIPCGIVVFILAVIFIAAVFKG